MVHGGSFPLVCPFFCLASAGPNANRPPLPGLPHFSQQAPDAQSGRSSEVEHNLAKVGVEGSNPFARSNVFNELEDSGPLATS
jgi:hypothetical protein